jgi:hypothetical protein
MTYVLAGIQVALLVAADIVARFTSSDLWAILTLLSYVCVGLQLLFAVGIIIEMLRDRFNARFPPVGRASMYPEVSPLHEIGWLHATGGCLLSLFATAAFLLVFAH